MALFVSQRWVEMNLRKKAAASCSLFALHLIQLLPSQCLQSTPPWKNPQQIVKELGEFNLKVCVVIKVLVNLG